MQTKDVLLYAPPDCTGYGTMFSISDLSRMLNLDRRIVMHVIKQHGVPAYRLVKANMYALPEVVAAINATKHYNYSRSQRGPTA